jgi:hypothetical protein
MNAGGPSMNKAAVATLSVILGLAVSSGAAAQSGNSPVITTNGTGVCTVTPSTAPGTAGGDWSIACGDINKGSGLTVISPPSASSAPIPVETAPAPEPVPEAAAEPAPVAETVTEPAPETTEVVASEPAPVAAEPAVDSTDLDGDNYADALEVELGLDPTNIDTDADGVADGDELNIYGTDPFTADSDGDGVLDGAELYDTRTDPLVWTDFSVAASTETVEQEPAVQEGM